jgi:hypothetical protein
MEWILQHQQGRLLSKRKSEDIQGFIVRYMLTGGGSRAG